MAWIDVFAVCLSLALSSGAIIAINFVNARLRRVEKWTEKHDYQQNILMLMPGAQVGTMTSPGELGKLLGGK